jgi:hypothetical protein
MELFVENTLTLSVSRRYHSGDTKRSDKTQVLGVLLRGKTGGRRKTVGSVFSLVELVAGTALRNPYRYFSFQEYTDYI